MNKNIIQDIRIELKNISSEEVRIIASRFFKPGEMAKVYGVKSPIVRTIGKKYLQQVKILTKKEIFAICEALWKSSYLEESVIACMFTESIHKKFEAVDIKIFESWIKNYVNNWASCDTFCNHTVGDYMMMYPEKTELLKKWAVSSNRWLRRAAAVSLIVPAKKGLFFPLIIDIATILLADDDDLVQKGYGWMLKSACQHNEKDVFDFVMLHKSEMPRTALRYAIEKMPERLKSQAMKK